MVASTSLSVKTRFTYGFRRHIQKQNDHKREELFGKELQRASASHGGTQKPKFGKVQKDSSLQMVKRSFK